MKKKTNYLDDPDGLSVWFLGIAYLFMFAALIITIIRGEPII